MRHFLYMYIHNEQNIVIHNEQNIKSDLRTDQKYVFFINFIKLIFVIFDFLRKLYIEKEDLTFKTCIHMALSK